MYDHPGHGLSSGARASIDDFSEYVSVLEDFLRIARVHLPGPYHLVAHSMGGAVTLDYLLTADPTGCRKSRPHCTVSSFLLLASFSVWTLFGKACNRFRAKSLPECFLRRRVSHVNRKRSASGETGRNAMVQCTCRVETREFSAMSRPHCQ